MLPTVFGSYAQSEAAESLIGALLEAGAAPEDISVVVRTHSTGGGDVSEGVGGLLAVDAGQAGTPVYGHVAIQSEGSDIYESRIGGGIGTSSPDDDVSSVAEMDDSQDAAEQMSYPDDQHSFSEEEERDVMHATNTGFFNISRTGRESLGLVDSGEDDMSAVPSELSSILLPGFALVLGDGPLATALMGAGVAAVVGGRPAAHLQDYLEDQAVPHDLAFLLARDFEAGGAVVAIAAAPGGLDSYVLQQIMEQQGARNVQTVEAAD